MRSLCVGQSQPLHDLTDLDRVRHGGIERKPECRTTTADLGLTSSPEVRGRAGAGFLRGYPDRLALEERPVIRGRAPEPLAANRIEELVDRDSMLARREPSGHRVVIRKRL